MKRPISLYILCLLHLVLGISATGGGSMMILSPNGSLLGMDISWLENSPFNTYLIPGLILFFLSGILPLFVFIGLVFKPQWKWANTFNIYRNYHWAWAYSLYSGIIVVAWISFQLLMTQYFWLQPVIIFLGLLILIFSLTPGVIRYFKIRPSRT